MNSNQADRKQTSDSSAELSGDNKTQTDNSDFLWCGRRVFLRSVGGVVAAGLLAGCISGGSGEDTGTKGDNEVSSVDDWLSDTSNYDGVEDLTGKNAVTVEVGAEGNNGANAFEPAAIKISTGTTVTWKWVNGYHNVIDRGRQFDSGEPEQGATFEHTFETPGVTIYYCEPHKSIGMKGAVMVTGANEGSGNTTATETSTKNA